jgi:hypothetical protein
MSYDQGSEDLSSWTVKTFTISSLGKYYIVEAAEGGMIISIRMLHFGTPDLYIYSLWQGLAQT